MNNVEFTRLVSEVYRKSFLNIMENYRCEVAEQNSPSSVGYKSTLEFTSSATIDAGAKDFEMSVSLNMPYATLEHSIPSADNHSLMDEGILEDWLCELSNLIIGSMKSELIRRNCYLQIGLPSCAAGEELEDIIPDGFEHTLYVFSVEHEFCQSVVSLKFFNEKIDCTQAETEGHAERSELEMF